MQIRVQRRNLFPSTALTAGTKSTQNEDALAARGVRLYVYVSGVTAGGGTDSISLCAVPPGGGNAVVLATFSKANMLATAGTYVFDFYPDLTAVGFAGTGSTLAAGANYGAAAITLPVKWNVQIVIGAANAATIAIDAEILP